MQSERETQVSRQAFPVYHHKKLWEESNAFNKADNGCLLLSARTGTMVTNFDKYNLRVPGSRVLHSVQGGNLVDKQTFHLAQKNWVLGLEKGLDGYMRIPVKPGRG